MASTIKIYKHCKITEEKNLIVESVPEYLSGLSSVSVEDFQTVKHDENISIKIDSAIYQITSTELLDFTDGEAFNYVSIQNDGETRPTYYFIRRGEWTAEKTVAFSLVRDELNTATLGVDYELGKKTTVLREHRDRILNSYYEEGGIRYYRRNIDETPEGTSFPMLKKEEHEIRNQNIDVDWYLVYRSEVEPTEITTVSDTLWTAVKQNSPIDRFICGSVDLFINIPTGNFKINTQNLDTNFKYFFGTKITDTPSGKVTGDKSATITEYMYLKYTNGAWTVYKIENKSSGFFTR